MTTCRSTSCIGGSSQPSSEPGLGNDDDVSGHHLDIRGDVSSLEQIANSYAVLSFLPPARADNRCAVAVGEIRYPADRNHDVEQRHLVAVSEDLRPRRFTNDTNLFAVGTHHRSRYDDVDHGVTDHTCKHLLDVTCERRRIFTRGLKLLHQRRGDLAVRAHRYRRGQL